MLKIAKPNEFDLVFKLKFPYYKSIAVTRDPKIPGNVLLDMTRVLELLKDDPREDFQRIRELIQGRLVDAQNFFVVDRLRSWLQSLFSQALNRISYRVELVAGVVSHLKYRTCGPAHTIYVYGDYEYSVDYVPAICLAAEQNVLPTKQLECFKRANTSYWEAIPKPLKPLTETSMISFRSSFYAVEKILLQDVHENCRNAIRFMKKFRDVKTNLGNCKSYYIKTLFLWKIIQEPESYWLNPLSFILADVSMKWLQYVDECKNNFNLNLTDVRRLGGELKAGSYYLFLGPRAEHDRRIDPGSSLGNVPVRAKDSKRPEGRRDQPE